MTNDAQPPKVKARFGFMKMIVVDECPYCHKTHHHNEPVGNGRRMADCFRSEYVLDFEDSEQRKQAK